MLRRLLLFTVLTLSPTGLPAAEVGSRIPAWVEPALTRICQAFRAPAPPDVGRVAQLLGRDVSAGEIERDGDRILRIRFAETGDSEITIAASLVGTTNLRVSLIAALPSPDGRSPIPVFSMAAAGAECKPIHAEELRLNGTGVPSQIIRYSGSDLQRRVVEALNPPVPEGKNFEGVRVAQIDTGVAYTLPEIASRLARDERGAILGYDFADYDARPFDREAGQFLFARPHGTGIASVLLREAPKASLIPIRAPSIDAKAIDRLPDEAVRRGAKIVLMSLGELRIAIWPALVESARSHPETLFVISAGDEGRDLDLLHSAEGLPRNLLLVTAVEADGTLTPEASWGDELVDLAIPSDRLATISALGAPALGSGADYAAARAAALAARFAAKDSKKRDGADLKRIVLKHAKALPPVPDMKSRSVRAGWIEKPEAIE